MHFSISAFRLTHLYIGFGFSTKYRQDTNSIIHINVKNTTQSQLQNQEQHILWRERLNAASAIAIRSKLQSGKYQGKIF